MVLKLKEIKLHVAVSKRRLSVQWSSKSLKLSKYFSCTIVIFFFNVNRRNGLSHKWSVLANKEPPKFKHFPVSPNLLRHYAFIGLQLCIALPHFISSQFLYIGISLRLKDISRTPCSFNISWSLNLLYLCV